MVPLRLAGSHRPGELNEVGASKVAFHENDLGLGTGGSPENQFHVLGIRSPNVRNDDEGFFRDAQLRLATTAIDVFAVVQTVEERTAVELGHRAKRLAMRFEPALLLQIACHRGDRSRRVPVPFAVGAPDRFSPSLVQFDGFIGEVEPSIPQRQDDRLVTQKPLSGLTVFRFLFGVLFLRVGRALLRSWSIAFRMFGTGSRP